MHNVVDSSQARRLRCMVSGTRLPVMVGVAIIAGAVLSTIVGCNVPFVNPQNSMEKEPELWAISLVGGFYLLLTGVWFLTRSAATMRLFAGLAVMLIGVLAGTWYGIWAIAVSTDGNFWTANVVFMVGLAVHLVGGLYVRKE